MIHILILVILTFAQSYLFAKAKILLPEKVNNENSLLFFKSQQAWTSDKIFLRHQNLSYKNHRRDLSWPYNKASTQAKDWGLSFDDYHGASQGLGFIGHKISSFYGQKINSNIYWQINLGAHQLEQTSTNEKHAIGTGQLKLQGYLFAKKSLLADYYLERDYAYPQLKLPAGLSNDLIQLTQSVSLQFKPAWQWRIIYNGKLTQFNDRNQFKQNQWQILYGVSPGWPWIWVGAISTQLENTKSVKGYWTPNSYNTLGGVVEAAFPLNKDWTGFTDWQWLMVKEDQYAQKNGKKLNVGLQYGDRNDFNIRVYYGENISSQEGRAWKQNSYNLTVSY